MAAAKRRRIRRTSTYGRTSRVRWSAPGASRRTHAKGNRRGREEGAATGSCRSLSPQPTSPTVIAVMPLRFSGPDTSLRPLERGFADLLVGPISPARLQSPRSSSGRGCRRSSVKSSFQRSGTTDSASNVRAAARSRRARRSGFAQTGLGASGLRADAAVVDVPTSQIRGTVNGSPT